MRSPTSKQFDTVILDFFGTVAIHDGGGVRLDTLLSEHGYTLDATLAREFWQDGFDGSTHDHASQSRAHYTQWQRERLLSLLDRGGVPASLAGQVAATLSDPATRGAMTAYPEADNVLETLRRRGLRLAICSNWDWDLHEAIESASLSHHFDHVTSSAWIGARKPHARIYEHMIQTLDADPARTLFVGDTWNCDIEGPVRHGFTAVYVRRPDREPDHTRTTTVDNVFEYDDLHGLLDLC